MGMCGIWLGGVSVRAQNLEDKKQDLPHAGPNQVDPGDPPGAGKIGDTPQDTAQRPFMLDLKRGWGRTLVPFTHDGPPPWPDGNCVIIGHWKVLNMHGENLGAFRGKFKLEELEVLPVGDRQVLVTDARVGREWLRWDLCETCVPLSQRLKIRSIHKKNFQLVPGEERLVGSVWQLVERRDMGMPEDTGLPGDWGGPRANIVAAILPGERLRFGDSMLICTSAAGGSLGGRSWELNTNGKKIALKIYHLKNEAGHYDAISFRVDQLDEQLILVPIAWMTKNNKGTGSFSLQQEEIISQVSYRLVDGPNKK